MYIKKLPEQDSYGIGEIKQDITKEEMEWSIWSMEFYV
jgi:hypothetical protein